MKTTNVRGGNYLIKIATLLREGATVEESTVTVAGFRCKQLIIGGQYKMLARTCHMHLCSAFELTNGKWERIMLPSTVARFIFELTRFSKYVFKEQGGIEKVK